MWLVAVLGMALAFCLRRLRAPFFIGLGLCVFALGALHAQGALDVPMPEPGVYEISATVHGGVLPRTDNRCSFVLTDIVADGFPLPGKAYCSLHYSKEPPALFDGARIAFSGRIYHPDGKAGEPHMDFRLWMRQRGLSFGIAVYQEVTVQNTPKTAPISDAAYRLRENLSARLERVMGDLARVPTALLLGERESLSAAENEAFQLLGIAHILSVSGLHISLLGGILLWLLGRLHAPRFLRFGLLLPLLGFYCWLTGFSASANRAAVMLLLAMLCALQNRRVVDQLTLLACGMLAVLLINPLHAVSAGFILSFSAMLGIVLYCPMLLRGMNRLWPPLRVRNARRHSIRLRLSRMQASFQGTLAVTLSAQLGVLLPTAYFFHHLPLYGVLINLVLVPFVTCILVPLYVLLVVVASLPFVGRALGLLASLLTDGLLRTVSLLSVLPHAAVRTASPPVVVCLGLGLALVLLSRRVPGSFRRRLTAAALTVLIALTGAYLQRPAPLRYIQLSVGQADSALLMDGDRTLLIDTGADADAALEYLLRENRDVDALILTHLHLDHAGGIEALLHSGIAIRHIYLPAGAEAQNIDPLFPALLERLRAEGIPVSELASGDELRYNKVSLHVQWPQRETVRAHQNANCYPLVLSMDLDGFTLLHMSDLEGSYEAFAAVPADVLKVAHHGSSSSTGDDFLRFVSPRFALVSASSSSRSLPSPETLSRLEAADVTVFHTGPDGDIQLSVKDGVLSVTPYKRRRLQ